VLQGPILHSTFYTTERVEGGSSIKLRRISAGTQGVRRTVGLSARSVLIEKAQLEKWQEARCFVAHGVLPLMPSKTGL
jgi:hypothetical protein